MHWRWKRWPGSFISTSSGTTCCRASSTPGTGLFQTPTDWTPVIRGVWVSALYTAIPLVVAFAVFGRRDVGGE